MNNDIKVLEEFCKNPIGVNYHEVKQAIENLVAGYKELENMLGHIEKFRDNNLSSEIDYVIALKSNLMTYLETDYIPKSKVREIKETLKDFENDGNDYDYIYKKGQYELCEELLQEGDK